jgi:hypothetical protein
MNNEEQYFDHRSKADKLYFTNDNQVFFNKQNARNHAMQLGDMTIATMTREEVEKETEAIMKDSWNNDEIEGLPDGLSEE